MPAVNRFDREPRFSLEEEIVRLTDILETQREAYLRIGVPLAETASCSGANPGVRIHFGPDRRLYRPTAEMLGMRRVEYRIFIPREEDLPAERGSMRGWHYFNGLGEITKLTTISAEELRPGDKEIARGLTEGVVTIQDFEAYNAYNAPGNLEVLGFHIEQQTRQLEALTGSLV